MIWYPHSFIYKLFHGSRVKVFDFVITTTQLAKQIIILLASNAFEFFSIFQLRSIAPLDQKIPKVHFRVAFAISAHPFYSDNLHVFTSGISPPSLWICRRIYGRLAVRFETFAIFKLTIAIVKISLRRRLHYMG